MDGFQQERAEKVDLVYLNLLGTAGRELASTYGIRVVPATLMFDSQGELVYSHIGRPNTAQMIQAMNRRA